MTRAPALAPARFDEQWPQDLRSANPLGFDGYAPPDPDDESVRIGLVHAPLGDYVLIDCDFTRSGGTMGVVAGAGIVLAYRRATERGLPVGALVSTGGARLQEGFFALVQMGLTVQAAADHRAAGFRSAVAYRSPTTGGVFASWANVADLRAAAPGALLGFGGPRVVEAVTGASPLPGSNTAESAWHDGNLDALVAEEDQQEWLERAIGLRAAPATPPQPTPIPPPPAPTAADALQGVRSTDHATSTDWLNVLVDEWVELRGRGQRSRAGFARIGGRELVIVALDRDRNPEGRPGLPTPADLRLVRRGIGVADRTGLPLLSLIDTPGVDPTAAAEREGLPREISAILVAMSTLRSPSVALCVGEGGSGAAMALAHADTLLMLERTVFEVIGAEAGAAVLYRDVSRAREVADAMRCTAEQLLGFGLIDAVLPYDPPAVIDAIAGSLDAARIGERRGRPERAVRGAILTQT